MNRSSTSHSLEARPAHSTPPPLASRPVTTTLATPTGARSSRRSASIPRHPDPQLRLDPSPPDQAVLEVAHSCCPSTPPKFLAGAYLPVSNSNSPTSCSYGLPAWNRGRPACPPRSSSRGCPSGSQLELGDADHSGGASIRVNVAVARPTLLPFQLLPSAAILHEQC